jgi:hypothetical protein
MPVPLFDRNRRHRHIDSHKQPGSAAARQNGCLLKEVPSMLQKQSAFMMAITGTQTLIRK